MKKVIVTTTINPPTEATIAFSQMKDWTLVVAGDAKTDPEPYKELSCVFVPYCDQYGYDPELSDLIGPNCIQRRNFGFLWAIKELKADIVATVDDDNMPLPGWGVSVFVGQPVRVASYEVETPAFDPLSVSDHPYLWHRGFPLPLLSESRKLISRPFYSITPDVQADLWDGDPDIDAICRMQHPSKVVFGGWKHPICCEGGTPSPFNSQNTFLSASVIPHYFMHLDVGRWDDIVASYYVQKQGFKVIYGNATVYQERVGHDVMVDFDKELWGYTNWRRVIQGDLEILSARAKRAFRLYQRHFE